MKYNSSINHPSNSLPTVDAIIQQSLMTSGEGHGPRFNYPCSSVASSRPKFISPPWFLSPSSPNFNEMNSICRTRTVGYLRSIFPAPRFYNSGKASSVNTAIERGLRKSKGLAFRTNSRSTRNPNDPRQKYLERNDSVRSDLRRENIGREVDGATREKTWPEKKGFGSVGKDKRGRDGGRQEMKIHRGIKLVKTPEELARKKPDPAGRMSRDTRLQFGKKGGPRTWLGDEKEAAQRGSHERPPGWGSPSSERNSRRAEHKWGRDMDSSREAASRATDKPAYQKKEWAPRPMEMRSTGDRDAFLKRSSSSSSGDQRRERDSNGRNSLSISSYERKERASETTEVSAVGSDDKYLISRRLVKSPGAADNRFPLSIPYTTPASEFLYGTSVVEAALTSRRVPARQLYKLYIYTGENREKSSSDRDVDLAGLARRTGVKVSRVNTGDGLRLMDKMSGGRPHNGYILEASPLPRLPITRLAEVVEEDGHTGFKVTVDYQSREDAAVNGTADFIKVPDMKSGSQPMVLLLDSIQDPGNLGGIIRTASFLGVSAIAISTRNSASFTPVVLKASAGASENITLFSVSKPEEFIQHSREAGWKIYAAVAPSTGRGEYHSRKSVSTDNFGDPLAQDPCILMLGGEGEGLRMNLRRKADVDLYIPGGSRRSRVDSLNVSVAAGVLCNSFLRQSRVRPASIDSLAEGDEDSTTKVAPEDALF